VLLGMTAVPGLDERLRQRAGHTCVTVNLGRYQGLSENSMSREVQDVAYRF
jgi:type VI secretion system protein ImpH